MTAYLLFITHMSITDHAIIPWCCSCYYPLVLILLFSLGVDLVIIPWCWSRYYHLVLILLLYLGVYLAIIP